MVYIIRVAIPDPRRREKNVPFLPHPLETEVAQVNRKPSSHPPDYLNIQPLSAEKTENFSHGATDRRCHSIRTSFAQLGNYRSVIDKLMMRFWKSKHSTQKSRDDKGLK